MTANGCSCLFVVFGPIKYALDIMSESRCPTVLVAILTVFAAVNGITDRLTACGSYDALVFVVKLRSLFLKAITAITSIYLAARHRTGCGSFGYIVAVTGCGSNILYLIITSRAGNSVYT